MKKLIGLAGLTLALSGCELLPRDVRYTIEPEKVLFAPSIKKGEALNVQVTFYYGGCAGFKQFGDGRTATSLKLSVIGSRREGNGVTCSTSVELATKIYTDPGAPARTNPFEVFVNGKSYGKVSVE